MSSPVNQHCAKCIGTLSFPIGSNRFGIFFGKSPITIQDVEASWTEGASRRSVFRYREIAYAQRQRVDIRYVLAYFNYHRIVRT